MNKHRQHTIDTLRNLGIERDDILTLLRISTTLSTWAEHECNGTIQREELVRCSKCHAEFKNPLTHSGCCDKPGCKGIAERYSGPAYWYNHETGKRAGRAIDRETGALKRAKAIAERYGLTIYHQGDPRGVSLYLIRPGDVPEGKDIGSYYDRGIAVTSS